jgi:hypothetical protein
MNVKNHTQVPMHYEPTNQDTIRLVYRLFSMVVMINAGQSRQFNRGVEGFECDICFQVIAGTDKFKVHMNKCKPAMTYTVENLPEGCVQPIEFSGTPLVVHLETR